MLPEVVASADAPEPPPAGGAASDPVADNGAVTASDPVADRDLVAALDRLAFAAVGMTARALGATPVAADLTVTQWRALALLHEADRPLRLGEVAEGIGMSLPSASRLVDRLGRRGLTRSSVDPHDRRARSIGLSPSGAAVVRAVLASRRELISTAVAVLDGTLPGATAATLVRLASTLDTVAGMPAPRRSGADEILARLGRIEVYDAGPESPVRYTILVPDGAGVGATARVCGLVEAILVPQSSGDAPTEPSWSVAVVGEPLGMPIQFDRLAPDVQERVQRFIGDPGASPAGDGAGAGPAPATG